MKYRLLTAAITLGALALSATAQAHWRFTKWGMSLDDVLKAGKVINARSVPLDPEDSVGGLDRLAVGETSEAGIDVEAQFYFTPNGKSLQLVRYQATDGTKCFDLERALVKEYGQGKRDVRDETLEVDGETAQYTAQSRVWRGDGGDLVSFYHATYRGESLNVCTWTFEPAT